MTGREQSVQTSSASPDAQALADVAAGRVSALRVIYDHHHAALYRFFNHATNYAPDVDDLVQTAFLSAAKAAASFDGRDNARPWLMAIAASVLYRRRRSLARWGRVLRELALGENSRCIEPNRVLFARDELRAVARALSRLSEKKRVALLLADVEELPYDQIAVALGVPVGTVWTRVHHARNELQSLLAREGGR